MAVGVGGPVDALLAAYPDRFTRASAAAWLADRRAALAARAGSAADPALAVSSGSATTGARAHARDLAAAAAHALRRLESGLATTCERCGARLPFDRLDGVLAAVRCAGCVPPYRVDTRWCR